MMDIDKTLRERYVVELRKPDVEKKERALIIKKLLKDKKWSIRELGRQYGFNKSTIEDWLLWDDPRVDKLIAKGLSDTEIYKVLRNNKVKSKSKGKRKKNLDVQVVDARLHLFEVSIRSMVSSGKYSFDTEELLKAVVNQCNRFTALIKREANGKGKKKR